MDRNPPGSSVPGILQARTLEWVVMSSTGDFPDPQTDPESLTSLALANGFFTTAAMDGDQAKESDSLSGSFECKTPRRQ